MQWNQGCCQKTNKRSDNFEWIVKGEDELIARIPIIPNHYIVHRSHRILNGHQQNNGSNASSVWIKSRKYMVNCMFLVTSLIGKKMYLFMQKTERQNILFDLVWRGGCIQSRNVFWVQASGSVTIGWPLTTRVLSDKSSPHVYIIDTCFNQPYDPYSNRTTKPTNS